jgi:hypothetical protein
MSSSTLHDIQTRILPNAFPNRACKYIYSTPLEVAGSIPDEGTGFLNWPNPSGRTMALESTQPLTEMSTRNLPGVKGRPARTTDNLTAIRELIV